MKFTPGKLAGMKAVSDGRGVIAAAAMDQRGSLQKSLGKEKGGEASEKDLEQFKVHVTEVLTKYASAILLDPEFGIPASKSRAKDAGLLLAYEKTGYDAQTAGRLPDLLDVWSVKRLKEAGADCIKILLYYAPADPAAHQRPQARLGRAHRRRVPRQRHSLLPRVHRLPGWRRREGRGLREEEAGDRRRQHGRVHQGPLRRRRDEGRDAHQHEVRRGHEGIRRTEGLYETGGARALSPHRRGRHQAVHLSVGRRQQRRVHRVARSGC